MNKKLMIPLLIYLISVGLFLSSLHPAQPDSGTKASTLITIYHTDTGLLSNVPLETYVTNVVACEVPSSFHIEALKAQAVASRTYAVAKTLKRSNPDAHPLAPLCDSTHCQAYNTTHDKNLDKIKEAVKETEGEMIYYNGKLIENALFHASSGGSTENSEDIFVSAVPYLRSVKSPYEKDFSRNGHGVGMSQQGANGMAEAGFDYKKILTHYYSGSDVY